MIVLFSYIAVITLYLVGAELTPPYFNLATGRKIYATATCGVNSDGPELYCKLVGANTEHDNQYFSVIQGQVCDVCDPSHFDKSHPPEYAIDGKETWWQSPPLSRGMKYNEVNLTIDFGQEFHVAYLYIRMGNSPRPGVWTLEKSSDYGQTWKSWQHFSDTRTDCEIFFGKQSLKPIEKDDDVICTTEYSKIVPLENGEIPVMLLNNRPSANNYFNSTILQEWTRATNVRIRLLRTKNLLGHLMSVARQDPTVTRRYFYSIKDISIGGRCMCNGHADTCDVLDSKSQRRLLACRCQHRTCGIQCNECCPGFEQKKWRQNTNARPFQCEPCNCFGHSNYCLYDKEIDENRLSVDIHGNYEGGGVCQNCLHNTEGINCNKCKNKFYRPYEKHWNETDVCAACDCNFFYSTGNCAEGTGLCECRKEFQPPNCDSCAYGYFGYPKCKECECNLNATEGYFCEAVNGKCPCKKNFSGHFCKECAEGYFNFPQCNDCNCTVVGSLNDGCDLITGQCVCLPNFGGVKCERCKDGYYSFPECSYCDCDIQGTLTEVCDKNNGTCLCRTGYGGARCDHCLPGYYNYPHCVPCDCSLHGSASIGCDATGKCTCLRNFAGRQCNLCSAGYYSYPECLPCDCDSYGSEGISCNSAGQCSCLQNFDGRNCKKCREGFYNFPACEECNCDPAGVVSQFVGCGSVPAGELCECKERVTGRICNQCKPLYWNLSVSNPEGCEVCDCYLDGTVGSLDTCDSKTGQCVCKPSVQNRQCKECKDGSFDLFGGNLFGCKDCACDIGGSRNPICDKLTGQCSCHPRIAGRSCTHPLTTHYFPTLYQFQFEYEDGYTPSGAFVRYQFDDEQFKNFSGKGFAVFSGIQNEVINEVNIFKSSVYRMVIRFVNPSEENITASILFTSDNPSELDQSTKVLFKPTKLPEFITVSGAKSDVPSPIVLDPGRYTISIKTDKHILLDYFVLLPAAYYEASILSQQIASPCELNNLDLCRSYRYPIVTSFRPSFDALVRDSEQFGSAMEFYRDLEHLSIINHTNPISVITDTQKSLFYNPDVKHTGRYVVVIDYITDRTIPETFFLQVRKQNDVDYGFATMHPCLYTMPCRQPVVDSESREKIFFFDSANPRPIEIYHELDDYGRIAILAVTIIPYEQWSIDYIKPQPVCVLKNGSCIHSSYRTVPDSKKLEFEPSLSKNISLELPFYLSEHGKNLTFLRKDIGAVNISSKVNSPGQYIILIEYYQPNHPQFEVLYRVEAGSEKVYTGKLNVIHCPSSIGCRMIVQSESNGLSFDIRNEFNLSLTNTRSHGLWVDYILIVPFEEYNPNLLQEEKFDQTKEFIQNCCQNNFYIQFNTSDYCRRAVFSLTADYNNGALPCNCDYDGSTSFECDPFGGQCPCKANVIGRQCDSCRTGFYGFPDCKHCDCPSTALCQKDTGECICPPHVTGEKCELCEPYTYGFHQIIGCEECNCSPLGVKNGNLQCDINNGTCLCRDNIEGRACDQCINGYFNFPECKPCKCNNAGTTFDVCDKVHEACFCKKNVVGSQCEHCAEGTYNLQTANPEGCTRCFCFEKTNRCESAYLRVFNMSILKNTTINTISFKNSTVEFEQWNIPLEEVMINETTIQVDFSYRPNDMNIVYFGMLHYFGNQHNHLTSYGGVLSYTLYYTTGPFGTADYGPDVILHSEESVLIHQSYEQPANAQIFHGTVRMIETSFQTIDSKPVSRGEFMMVLRNLKAIYIRASYWNPSIVAQLSDVYISIADEDTENYNLYEKLSVEKCYCPPGYTGLSCEDCASGYYRDSNGPFGGYCIQCECNGHADTCDCDTGICQNCKHFTTGNNCEKCLEGYHGNATLGTPNDCMICACPLPYDSNNFATGCEISVTGNEIHCECKPGYIGARCESCAPGFYGQPEKLGDFCKPCQCSGNIDVNEPGSCDTVAGECLKCLNNTYGSACNLCAPGFYGDAIKLKDCKSCDCDLLGTNYCDSFLGTCKCHTHVIGERCDRCEEDHYGYDSGMGCKPCDCAIASKNSQCNDHSGNCLCQKGVAGRQCDKCTVDHWNYTADGCTPCSCNKGYSRGFGCNSQTGQCECLPGVIGDKCDSCPNRWALLKDYGCIKCDICIHALLDDTDKLYQGISPVFDEFQTVALSYFTAQKLNYFNTLADKMQPKVEALDPKVVNLTPSQQEIETLEMDAKGLSQQMSIAATSVKESLDNGNALEINSKDILEKSQKITEDTINTIKDIENFEKSFDSSASTKADNALTQVKIIFEELSNALNENDARNMSPLESSQEILENMKLDMLPVIRQDEALQILKKDVRKINSKLKDLNDWSEIITLKKSEEASNFNDRNRELFLNSKFGIVSNQTKETEDNILKANNLFINGDLTLGNINNNLLILKDGLDDLKDSNGKVDKHLISIDDKYNNIQSDISDGEKHISQIANLALNLTEQYSNITSNSEEAIKASTAYSDIVNAVNNAQKLLKSAKYNAGNATELSSGIRDRAANSDGNSNEIFQIAQESLNSVQNDLSPHLNKSSIIVGNIFELHKNINDKLENMNLALEELPKHSNNEIWKNKREEALKAEKTSKLSLNLLKPIIDQIPLGLKHAKHMPKYIDTATKDITQTAHHADKSQILIPQLSALVDEVNKKQENVNLLGSDLADRIDKLKKKIEMARTIVNNIKLGATFHPNTVLELKPPENLSRLATNSKISAYFNTSQPNGFLVYLGNENKTGDHPAKGQDFMALEIENGFPILKVDLGNGPEKLINDKYVADGNWYRVVVDRAANHVKFEIHEQLNDGTIQVHKVEQQLPGTYSVFDVDENSKLFVGGYSDDFTAPEDLRYGSFEGQIENLKINDEDVGLWNFVDGGMNMDGAYPRNKLILEEPPITGYRFNGNGYVIMDARPHHFKTRSTIHFRFKAPRDSRDGILFYAGKGDHFIAVELKAGAIFFQYKLGEHKTSIGTNTTFNDDEWHRVEAERDGRKGALKVDRRNIYQEEFLQGDENNLLVSNDMYFGGHPDVHNAEIMSKNFDGCIDEVVISGTPIDLSRNLKAVGIRPGCPEKFSSFVSYKPGKHGYIKKENITSEKDFQINLKFQTRQEEGILFYASSHSENASIALALKGGKVVLRSMQSNLATVGNKYNDGEWHVVTATHNQDRLQLIVDDTARYSSDSAPPKLKIAIGDMFFGGLPLMYSLGKDELPTKAYFIGCISDVTLNGEIMNFANFTEKSSANLDGCPSEIFDYDISSIPIYYIDGRRKDIEPHKTKEDPTNIIHAYDREKPVLTRTNESDADEKLLEQIPSATITSTTPLTEPQRTPWRINVPSKQDVVCKLPITPNINDIDASKHGYRFGTVANSRLEIKQMPNKMKKAYDISLEFKTESFDGLLFYAADASHTDFFALYLKGGKLHHVFRIGQSTANISSDFYYNDNNWHEVRIIRQQLKGELIIDKNDIHQSDLFATSKIMSVQVPFYIGNVNEAMVHDLNLNLEFEKSSHLTGCIRAIKMQNRLIPPNNFSPIGVIPCTEDVEKGVYFNKGYVKLRDRFNVGAEFTVSFDIKPRSTTGMLLSVHGRNSYLILQMLNGTIDFTVDNGEGPITAIFKPSPGENLCDGKWRTVEAIKSQYVITLLVNAVSSQPAIGSATHPLTETTRPLFLGGHPHLMKVRGLKARRPYIGCIRNLKIRDQIETIRPQMTVGDIQVGVCPIN